MDYADVAPSPSEIAPVWILCAGFSCLFVVSLIILLIVLVRRSRDKKQPPAA